MPTRVLPQPGIAALSPFIPNIIIKISEISFNSHPSFKSFKPWQTYSFPTKE